VLARAWEMLRVASGAVWPTSFAPMLTIRDVTKTFNARTLFSAASMTIN
jgi:hypothetical protein